MKTLLSLFDYSGAWASPFAANGWNVIQLDIKHGFDINDLHSAEKAFDTIQDCDGIIAAPPCTDFAVSGAQYWKKKDANGATKKALQLVYQVKRLADLFAPTDPDYDGVFFWAVENPVGRMGTLADMGKPYYFNPCDFAGYTNPSKKVIQQLNAIRNKNGIGVTNEENDLVLQYNAYTKKTGLWGQFNHNLGTKKIEPVKTAPQGSFTQRLGGKSDKTKELRSYTPEGFAQAFYEANHNFIYNDHCIHPLYQ